MYEQVHVLSPLVSPREFYFLRYCQQIEEGLWVIANVSYSSVGQTIIPSRSWRLPSGCMIQDMPNGCSKVGTACKVTLTIANSSVASYISQCCVALQGHEI